MIRRTVHFDGHVQGVGFRYTAQAIARRLGIVGFVQNLPDGRVKLVVEAEPQEIDRLLVAIQAELGRYIRHVEQTTQAASGEFTSFVIEH